MLDTSENILSTKIATVQRVCLILPSLQAGGMERVMSELAIYFSERKNTETYLILLSKQERFYSLPASIKIYEPGFTFEGSSKIRYTYKCLFFIRRTLDSIRPQAILSFGEMYNSLVLLATVALPYPVFVSDRSRPDKDWGMIQNLLRRLVYPRAKGIICQTEYAKSVMSEMLSHSNIKVIGNPIKFIGKSLQPKNDNIILSVGRLIKSKRHHVLIELFSQAKTHDWKLLILGDGPEFSNLQALIVKLNLSEHVFLVGSKKNVEEYYQTARFFAFASDSEGFPNAIGEAMSAGLAPLSFDFIAGASDLIVDDYNGFLVPPHNHPLYVQRLRELMTNDNLSKKLGDRAYERSRELSIEIIGEQYHTFILK